MPHDLDALHLQLGVAAHLLMRLGRGEAVLCRRCTEHARGLVEHFGPFPDHLGEPPEIELPEPEQSHEDQVEAVSP
jgi:hypothetical protein